jgi:purine nucleoside permease
MGRPGPTRPPRALKVVVIAMFDPEAEPWIAPLGLTEHVPVAGLSPDHPALLCNRDDVCLLTTGMGHANAAASMLAVALDPTLDLRRTYFIVAGIAGIDPAQGTIGSGAWARYLVDFGLQHEIDAREIREGWSTGYFGILTSGPGVKPPLDYHTEVFQLDETLLQKVLALTRDLRLDGPGSDSADARAYRANYPSAPANQPPRVIQCDTLAGDTWWHGDRLGEHAREWVRLLTDGKGTYCTTQQEDNATYGSLVRAAAIGRVDLHRVAVLRTGANFDRPYPGQAAWESIGAKSGGFEPARHNLHAIGGVVVRDIVARWNLWRDGVPAE